MLWELQPPTWEPQDPGARMTRRVHGEETVLPHTQHVCPFDLAFLACLAGGKSHPSPLQQHTQKNQPLYNTPTLPTPSLCAAKLITGPQGHSSENKR